MANRCRKVILTKRLNGHIDGIGPGKKETVAGMAESFDFLTRIGRDPAGLIQALRTIQELYGMVSDAAVTAVAAHFGIPRAEVEAALAFYPSFRRTRPGRFRIAVCRGAACRRKNSDAVMQWISESIGIGPGETGRDGLFSLEWTGCLGCCAAAPAMKVNDRIWERLDRDAVRSILRRYRDEEQSGRGK